MEAEYNEVLHWESPGPAVPGESSIAPDTPLGEGIQLAGIIQPLKGRQTTSLMFPGGTPPCAEIPERPQGMAARAGQLA